MIRCHRLIVPLLVTGAMLCASCRELTAPASFEPVDEAELTFVRFDPEGPRLKSYEVAFWAVHGQDREVQISYDSGLYGNGKCLLFRVPADAVPIGVAPGDSVRVTIRVVDQDQFRFEFLPDGLQFDPEHPARLEIRYRWADPDYDGDGDVDARDLVISETFGLWRMTGAAGQWERVPAERKRDQVEIHATVMGFTQYALATD